MPDKLTPREQRRQLHREHQQRIRAQRVESAKALAGPSENKQVGPDATEAAQRLADENGVDLGSLKGTGANGRITVSDVQAAVDKRAD